MAACGLPEPQPDHAERTMRLALDMLSTIAEFDNLEVRIGINSGPVLAGIIGHSRIAFDLWGETVNLASRMESHGVTGCIQVTQATYDLLGDHYNFQPGREIEVKGKGLATAYLLRSSGSET